VTPGRVDLDVAVFPALDAPMGLPDARVRALRWPPTAPRGDLVRALSASEGSTIVVVPDPIEAEALVHTLRGDGRHVLVLRGDQPAAERTRAWERARHGACVVIGGRVAVLAPVPDLSAFVVLDDADEALKDERSPAWHARDLAAERARRAGARFDIVSPMPTVEAIVGAERTAAVERTHERAGWPRLDVVDLRDQAPGERLLSGSLAAALHTALADRGRALCVLNRRGKARLLACAVCRELVRCPQCGGALAELGDALVCPRCGASAPAVCTHCGSGSLRTLRAGVTGMREQISRLLPRAQVVAVDSASAPLPAFDVAVGTEAVLHRVRLDSARPVRLVAFLDFDQELLAPRYRAVEQALWLLVRAARVVGPRAGGGVVLVQTRLPTDPVVVAAGDASLEPVLEAERDRRQAFGFPPFAGLAELSGGSDAVAAACDALRASVDVLGPTDDRALLRAPSAAALSDGLAATDLSAARARGRLRVEVDPLRV
jgi:primosomal protein N' (replication factor Y)